MYIPLGTSVSALTYLIGIVVFVKDAGDLTKATVIWSLSYIPGCMLLILLLHKKVGVSYRPSFNLHLWRYHLRESVFFLLSGALMLVYRSTPILLLMYFSNEYAVGLFAAPYRVVIMLCGAGFMLPSAFYPVLSEQHKKDRLRFIEVHKNLQKYMVLLGIPVALLGTVFARPIVNLCFGVDYANSIPALSLMIWLVPAYFVRFSYGIVLLASGHQRAHNIATFIGVIGMVSLCLLGIPNGNILGATFAVLGAEVTMLLSMMVFTKKSLAREARDHAGLKNSPDKDQSRHTI